MLFKPFPFRRNKEFCHECRYCCTLSVCTTAGGSTYLHTNQTLEKVQSRGLLDGAPTASFGFSTDMRMYKSYDFRCLKPKDDIPIEKWPHYEMHGYRAAKTEEELDVVEEIPFDKYFFNFEDPEVLNAMTDGTEKGRKYWRGRKRFILIEPFFYLKHSYVFILFSFFNKKLCNFLLLRKTYSYYS